MITRAYRLDRGFRRWRFGFLAVLLLALGLAPQETGAETPTKPADSAADPSAPWNLDTPTFGGKQFWTDELVFRDWRIQRLAISGHYRLLDDRNVRQAWGTWEQCLAVFEQQRAERELAPLGREVVLLLHGLIRSRDSMEPLQEYLSQNSPYTVMSVSYASTRGKTAEHAAALAKVMERLPGVERVHLVGHSLGNLVIRHYLGDRERGVHGERRVPQIGRIVMLAPPNQGAEIARRLRENSLFRTFWGVTGQELATHWDELEPKLAIPSGEFGIIAGAIGTSGGRNPLVAGDDDLVVAVSETRLTGARDFLELPVLHSLIVSDDRVLDCTLRFLQQGYFVTPKERQPILE